MPTRGRSPPTSYGGSGGREPPGKCIITMYSTVSLLSAFDESFPILPCAHPGVPVAPAPPVRAGPARPSPFLARAPGRGFCRMGGHLRGQGIIFYSAHRALGLQAFNFPVPALRARLIFPVPTWALMPTSRNTAPNCLNLGAVRNSDHVALGARQVVARARAALNAGELHTLAEFLAARLRDWWVRAWTCESGVAVWRRLRGRPCGKARLATGGGGGWAATCC